MSDQTIPDRSMHLNMTDINGTHHTAAWDRLHNKAALWRQFIDMQAEQPPHPGPGYQGIGSSCAELNDKILKEKED